MSAEPKTRDQLLFSAFTNLPKKMGPYTLRPISPFTYSLLENIDSPLLGRGDASKVIESVAEFVWMHTAEIDEVIRIETRDDFPKNDVNRVAITLEMGESLAFVQTLTNALLSIAAAVAEHDEDDSGKPQAEEQPPIGLHPSSSPLDAPETLPESATSSSTLPFSEPSSISMLPTLQPEQKCDGAMTSQETSAEHPPSNNASNP